MKKSLALIAALFISSAHLTQVHAQPSPRPVAPSLRELDKEAYELYGVIRFEGHRLSEEQARRALELLRQARESLGSVRPPLPPPSGNVMSCEEEFNIDALKAATATIKEFAYGSTGLDKSSSDAEAYARNWVKVYPCRAATDFVRVGISIKAMAYNSSGMNMNKSDAAAYIESHIAKTCDTKVDFPAEYTKIYNYAYGRDGLNMSSGDAAVYTRQKIEKLFGCAERSAFLGF